MHKTRSDHETWEWYKGEPTMTQAGAHGQGRVGLFAAVTSCLKLTEGIHFLLIVLAYFHRVCHFNREGYEHAAPH